MTQGSAGFRSLCVALALVWGIASTAVAAVTYTDSGYALTFAVPEGYSVERKQLDPGVNLFLNDRASDGFCTITFIPTPRFEGTQEDFDKLTQPRLAELVDDERSDRSLGPVTPFVLGGAKGVIFEATTEKSRDESGLRFLFVYLEAVDGHAQFVCATSKETFSEVKPTFERLFRSIHLP